MANEMPFHVAIVGGGLCGITLGIALQRHNISFTLYESRSSFTEIGAGINFGPSALRCLSLIDPSLGDEVLQLATRNPAPDEDIWAFFRYGAAWGDHADGDIFHKISSPPTGNMTLHRQELLSVLAHEMGSGHAEFNKKLASYTQTPSDVTLHFTDNTSATTNLLIACDGIHSKVRACMFGPDSPLSKPVFSSSGAYRALIPMETALSALGESARLSTLSFGPGGYLITYPVSGGTKLNCGAWTSRHHESESSGEWPHDDWVLPNQREQFQRDFGNFGPRAQKILSLFDPDPDFWATHHHAHQPAEGSAFVDGLVLLIGDAAHSMPPHQGAGASQAMEDAYVLAEVLSQVSSSIVSSPPIALSEKLKAALQSVHEIRAPRAKLVHKFSHEAGERNFTFWERKLEGKELEGWIEEVERRLRWIWQEDMQKEAEEGKRLFAEKLEVMEMQSDASDYS
ncbi:hypothetical protein CERZMDRAFT_80936 [Cercospora zeae-maydis SCOH1-5]|uniref:FAD-binding domain-containing protein n=1 Tax=Cercospora zeae-maydis SCOH1-5 TaxID=717836 RepID=A0A6A6FUJ4_9PEZI|nr:hypothetical protein CERZMDRAFT_80936 [Cercospora zeae-maydis SCOH1-5]